MLASRLEGANLIVFWDFLRGPLQRWSLQLGCPFGRGRHLLCSFPGWRWEVGDEICRLKTLFPCQLGNLVSAPPLTPPARIETRSSEADIGRPLSTLGWPFSANSEKVPVFASYCPESSDYVHVSRKVYRPTWFHDGLLRVGVSWPRVERTAPERAQSEPSGPEQASMELQVVIL